MNKATQEDRRFLKRTLELARESVQKGSSPIGCVIVDGQGNILAEGRNRAHEPWPDAPHEVADSSFAHAEMVAFYRLGRIENPEECTLYSSLEPCLMCGGAIGMVQLKRVVWACADPWGGSGRLIQWDLHPAYQKTEVVPCPFEDLEQEASRLFAPEARKAYPEEGWQAWVKRYPETVEVAEAKQQE